LLLQRLENLLLLGRAKGLISGPEKRMIQLSGKKDKPGTRKMNNPVAKKKA
jgi:hypothetical protein